MHRSFAPIALTAIALVLAGSSTARTSDGGPDGVTYAIIGDTPYGAGQLVDFPRLVSALNGDPDVELTVHLGDIKDGASPCSDAYFDQMRANFDTLEDRSSSRRGTTSGLDCHRPAAGGYSPTERLARFRSVFYPRANKSLGERRRR